MYMKKVSEVLIMAGKYLIVIGITIVILSLLFPYKASASIVMNKYSSAVGDYSALDTRVMCTPEGTQLLLFFTDSTNTNTFAGLVPDCTGEIDVTYNIDMFTPMVLDILECSSGCETYVTIEEVVNSGFLTDRKTYTVYPVVTKGILFGFTKEDGVPTSNPSDLLASVGTVSTDVFSSSLPYMLVFIGVPLAFYVIHSLKKTVVPKETKKDRIIRDKDGKHIGIDISGDGYKRIVNKDGQISGYMKE